MIEHANLRRLMARLDLTVDQVVERSGVDERTVKGILTGAAKPHARTLHRLAAGLGVPADEFFQSPSLLAHRAFDRQTNPVVDDVVQQNRELFRDWTQRDFDELYTRIGTGGAVTYERAVKAAEWMNLKRQTLHRAEMVLKAGESEILAAVVDLLFARIAAQMASTSIPPAQV